MTFNWQGVQSVKSISYTCGYCGTPLASERGWYATMTDVRGSTTHIADIRICHNCYKPTFIRGGDQTPGVAFGNPVSDVSDKGVNALYEEARTCTSAGAYTSAVLACRKLLMHIAVLQGAEEGKSFVFYVNHLSEKGFLPPGSRDWVDHIRQKGNEANHEITIMTREDAEELISFSELILRFLFEYPARIARRTAPPSGAA